MKLHSLPKILRETPAHAPALKRRLLDADEPMGDAIVDRVSAASRTEWSTKVALRVVITVAHLALGTPVACASAPGATPHGNEETIFDPPHPETQASEAQQSPAFARNEALRAGGHEPKRDRGGGRVQAR